MSPGQTGHITGQMGRVPGTDGTHIRGCPAKILYVYWFFCFPTLRIKVLAGPNEFPLKFRWTNGSQNLSESSGLHRYQSIECSSLDY